MTTPPTTAEALDTARRGLAGAVNSIINRLAGRTDLIARLVWDQDTRAPAWYDPARREITINATHALGAHTDPDTVDPVTETGRSRHPVLFGLCCHESGHARATRWKQHLPSGTLAMVVNAAELLEELRIEHRHLHHRPQDRPFLRASALALAVPPAHTTSGGDSDRWQAGHVATLALGRIDAGVLTINDLRHLLPALHSVLGVAGFDRLRHAWCEAITLDDGDVDGLLAAARAWLAALGLDEHTDLDTDALGPVCTATGGNHDDQPQPDPGNSSGWDAALGALAAVLADEAAREAHDALPTAHADTATVTRKRADAAQQHEIREITTLVFGSHRTPHDRGPITGRRRPERTEHATANQLAARLRTAQYRGKATTKHWSNTPPGRVDGRQLNLARTQRAAGFPVTATPFRQTRRRRVPQPPLAVGIACDVSGSMRWSVDAVASGAWILATALQSLDARCATVAFGDTVTPVTAPGAVPREVTELAANDGSHAAADAVAALDGALRLSTTRAGARLLFLISDLQFSETETTDMQRHLDRLAATGTTTLCLDVSGNTVALSGVTLVRLHSAADLVPVLADATVRALRAT